MKTPTSWQKVLESPYIHSIKTDENLNAVIVILNDDYQLSHNGQRKMICKWSSPTSRILYDQSSMYCKKYSHYIGITAFHYQESLESLKSQWWCIQPTNPSVSNHQSHPYETIQQSLQPHQTF